MKKSYMGWVGVIWVLLSASMCPTVSHAEESRTQKQTARSGFFGDLLSVPLAAGQSVDGILNERIFNLADVRVSGARLEGSVSDAPATGLTENITFVGEDEIERNVARSLPQILSQKEGVNYTDDLGQGLGARIDLRGFGGEGKNTLVLFDGVRAVEPFDNSVTWHLYPTEFMKRVEIRRGGGSTIYGEGAFAGVIGLESKEPTQDLKITADQGFGSFASQRSVVEASGTVSGVGFYGGARYASTDGYRQNSDQEAESTLLKLKAALWEFGSVENVFFFADNKTGIAGPLLESEVAQDRRQKDPDGQFGDRFTDDVTQNSLTVRYLLEPIGVELSNQAAYRLRHQGSVQSFGGSFPGMSLNDIRTETYSDVLQAAWGHEGSFYKSDLIAGVEWSIDDMHNPFTFVDFSFGPFSSDRAVDRRMIGGFIQERILLWDRLTLEPGIRFDRIDWDIYDHFSPNQQKRKFAEAYSPKIGAQYQLFDPLSVYADYSESFKAPDSNTLIFETPNLFTPTPDIDAQTARHHELGVRYAHPVFGSVRADVFYIETRKEILFNDLSNRNENFDTVRQGFELANEIALCEGLQLFSNYTYTDAAFDGGSFDGRQIPLTPESRWTAGLVAEPVKHLSLTFSATGVYDQYALNDFNNRFSVEDYWTAGLKAAYRVQNWEGYVRLENLFDERYSSFVTSDGVSVVNLNPAPGFNFEVGVKFES